MAVKDYASHIRGWGGYSGGFLTTSVDDTTGVYIALTEDAPTFLEFTVTGVLSIDVDIDLSPLQIADAIAVKGRPIFINLISILDTDLITNKFEVNAGGAGDKITLDAGSLGTPRKYEAWWDGTNWHIIPFVDGGAFIENVPLATWGAGVTDQIEIIAVGVPGAGQIGPHGKTAVGAVNVFVKDGAGDYKLTDFETTIVEATQNVIVKKPPDLLYASVDVKINVDGK